MLRRGREERREERRMGGGGEVSIGGGGGRREEWSLRGGCSVGREVVVKMGGEERMRREREGNGKSTFAIPVLNRLFI